MRKKDNITEEELKEFKFGIIAATQSAEDEKEGQISIVHFCGYPKKPTQRDFELLKEELNTDPEFHLVGRIDKDVFLLEATPEMVQYFTGGISTIDYE